MIHITITTIPTITLLRYPSFVIHISMALVFNIHNNSSHGMMIMHMDSIIMIIKVIKHICSDGELICLLYLHVLIHRILMFMLSLFLPSSSLSISFLFNCVVPYLGLFFTSCYPMKNYVKKFLNL